jgi:DNA-binding IscR family transcriptional regulator
MNLGPRTLSALGVVSILFQHQDDLIPAKAIAKESGNDYQSVCKVLQTMQRAGIVRAFMGPRGGYRIEKYDVDVLEIIELFEGKIELGKTGSHSIDGLLRVASRDLRRQFDGFDAFE